MSGSATSSISPENIAAMFASRKWQRFVVMTTISFHVFLLLRLADMTSRAVLQPPIAQSAFVAALTSHADSAQFILLAMVDESFVDMAANFYESSLVPNGIRNFMFVGVGQRACENLREISPACFHYVDDVSSGLASAYNTVDHNRKMNYRTDMIIEALEANFTVLHTDVDVVLFDNPVEKLKVKWTSDVWSVV